MIGDFITGVGLSKVLDTDASHSPIEGVAGSLVTITSISLRNTGATTRYVTMYKDAIAVNSEVIKIEVPADGTEILGELDYTATGAETYYFKQDTGTDVHIHIQIATEVIS